MKQRKTGQMLWLRIFSIVGIIEGISFLLLLLVAMPLKYGLDIPEAVTVAGGAHGFLFVLYVIVALAAAIVCRWPAKYYIGAFIASVLPFGPFVIDRIIRKAYSGAA